MRLKAQARCVALDCLVEIRVEGHLLHVLLTIVTRALGHIPGGIFDEDRPVLDPPGPRVLGNRVGLYPDDLTPIDANSRSVSNALLVSMNALLVHDSASANGNMIALGKTQAFFLRLPCASKTLRKTFKQFGLARGRSLQMHWEVRVLGEGLLKA